MFAFIAIKKKKKKRTISMKKERLRNLSEFHCSNHSECESFFNNYISLYTTESKANTVFTTKHVIDEKSVISLKIANISQITKPFFQECPRMEMAFANTFVIHIHHITLS